MGFTDEFLALRKKKEKKNETKTSTNESFANEFLKLRAGEKSSALSWRNDEIAPVREEKTTSKWDDDDIAPVKEEKRTWFDKGVFDDGYQFGDIFKGILGTSTDATTHIGAGVIGIGEKLTDAGAMLGTALNRGSMMQAANNEIMYNAISGKEESASKTLDRYNKAQGELEKETTEFVAKDLYNEEEIAKKIISDPVKKVTGIDSEEDSFFGEKTDALAQSAGQLGAQIAFSAIPGIGQVGGMALMGTTAFGSEAESAFNQGATFDEGMLSATISAGAEILTEKLGGISFGGKTVTDAIFGQMSSKMTSKLANVLISTGKITADALVEGGEELLSGYIGALGQQMTYMEDKEIEELFSNEDKLESFIGGVILGGIGGTGEAATQGKGYVTGLNKSEQKVVDKLYNDATEGKNLTAKEKKDLYNNIVENMDKGDIDTDTIESVLGGDDYKAYKEIADLTDGMTKEFDELGNKTNPTLAEQYKYSSLMQKIKDSNEQKKVARTKLDETMSPFLKNSRLAESYNEVARKKEAFNADLSQYDEKQKVAVERAIKSGVLNNTNKSHALVDTLSKIEADKGIVFDYTNNKKLKESGFAIEGKTVNGFEKNGTVTLNVQSAKSWQSTVGHEITHVLEGTDAYGTLQETLFKYAESKGELETRRTALTELYNGIEADIDKELTADLVGDYLFSDKDFIRNLTGDMPTFKKIYNEIKYFCKVATGRELTEIEKVRQEFDKVWKEYSVKGTVEGDGKVNLSVSVDNNGNELSPAVQKRFANSKAVDENGDLKVLYHGTASGEFYTFDKSKGSVEGDFGSGFYFTDSESDVKRNYEGGGPDFENKIDRRAEQIESEEEIDYIKARKKAINELFKGGNKHTVYLNIENPAIVGETYLFDYESFAEEYDRDDYDSDEDYEGDVENLIADKIDEIIWDIDRNVDIYSTDGIAEVLWNAVNEGGIGIEELKTQINNLYLEDNNGNLVGNEVTRQIIESLGYDGIIDNTVSGKFKGMNLNEDTTHYIVFKPNQIKSIDNQNPTDDPDIRFSLSNGERIESKLTKREISEQSYAALDKLQSGESVALEELEALPEVIEGVEKVKEYTAEFLENYPEFKNVPKKDLGTHLITSAEREQLRNEILQDRLKSGSFTYLDKDGKEVYNGSVEKGKRLDIVIGLPAAGKSTSIVLPLSQYHKSVVVDSDIIKQALPEFNEGWGASLVHEESSMLNSRLFAEELALGNNIVLPIVGSKVSSIEDYLETAKLQNYDVHLHLNELNSSKAMGRMLRRYFSDGRFIPPSVSYKYGDKPTEIYEEMKNRSDLSGYSHWNNDVAKGQRPTHTDSSGSNRALVEYSRTWRASRETDIERISGEVASGESQSNEIAPVKETSSKGGVFSLSKQGEQIAPVGNYSTPLNETALAPTKEVVAENTTPTETVEENAMVEEAPMPNEIAPMTEEEATTNAEEDLKKSAIDKNSFFSNKASDLYEEVKGMRKGVRVSRELSYLLDTLDLSEENKYESYRSLRTALINIKNQPDKVVNQNSAIEATARKMINDAYENAVYELDDLIAIKIKALESDIANNKALRIEAENNYNSQIAELQERYNSKKNKNTKVANQILQSISRLERLKASADASYRKRISNLEARAEKMKDPKYNKAMYKQAKMQEHAKWAEDLLGDTTTWKDKKLGIQYEVNTERRNLRDIVRDENGNKDVARADAIYDATMGEYNRNQAALNRRDAKINKKYEALKVNRVESVYANMLGELRHNPDTTLTEKVVNEYYEKHKNKIDTEKVDKFIDYVRSDLDTFFEELNAKLREQGMKEIPYRKGYFPHKVEPKQNFIQKLLNWKTQDNEIPTSIAGLTEDFKPVKSWQSFDKQRHSDETDYDLLRLFQNYKQGALDWIYHIEDIQKRRAIENHIRFTHSDEGVQAKIKEVYANEEYDADEAQAEIEKYLAQKNNPLNNFVQDFMTHTNILTGKKNSLDRGTEQKTNRKIYTVMMNVQNRTSANMVLANVRSALTNFIPITQSWAQVSPLRSLQATKDTIANAIKDDGMIEKSAFLTNRLREADSLYKTNWDKILDKAGIMFEIVDNFSSQVIWRSKYNDNLAKGMSESEAIANADQFAENVMAGRSKGNMPTLFESKSPLAKAFTMFQLEVNNQYGYFFKDVPNDLKAEANHWKLNLAKGYTTAFIGAYVYNALLEQVAGSGAALDPIGIIEDLLKDLGLFDDDEEDELTKEKLTKSGLNFADNVIKEIPFVGNIAGGGRIPMSSGIPYADNGFFGGIEEFVNDVSNGNANSIDKELQKPFYNLLMPVGGGQLKKTVQGLSMFDINEDHPVAGSYTDSGNLRFPVEDTIGNRIQAGIFGQYASKNAREYFDGGYAPLKEKQINEYMDVDMPIADYWKYREGLKGLKGNAEKADYINSLDITDRQKNVLMNNILDRKEDVDMSYYDNYNSFEEFDYAQKNPEKYAFFNENGISYDYYSSLDEDGKAACTWAYNNPEKYKVSKVVTDNVVEYRSYTSDLYDIRADKDANGESISGSAKEKKIDYINNLDLEYGQKIILLKMQYKSDDTYNADIVDYLNNLDNLSYEDRIAIFTELGFTVKGEYVYWD